jgi:hypothetical protein
MQEVRKKSGDSKESFYEELEQVFHHFPKYHMKIPFGTFNAKVGREDIIKLTMKNAILHQDSNDTSVRIVNFATSTILFFNNTMFPHRNSHKYTWTSYDGKTHNQISHILVDKRWHSSILDVRSFKEADCYTDHYLEVAKVRERLAICKQAAQKFERERFSLMKLNQLEVRKHYQIDITNRFAALENLDNDGDINRAWENIKGDIQTSARESLVLDESKQHKR